LVFRLSEQLNDYTNVGTPGDRTLLISRNQDRYYFSTYSCEVRDCTPNLSENVDAKLLESHWTWFYFGYNRKIKTAFGYI